MELEGLQDVYNNLREEIVKRVEIEHQRDYAMVCVNGQNLTVSVN